MKRLPADSKNHGSALALRPSNQRARAAARLTIRPESMLRSRAIQKKPHRSSTSAATRHPLVGRRVAVPQRFTEVEDDGDGFCFGAIVVSADDRRAVIKFDYTGEREAWSLKLVREWLADKGVDPLCDLLGAL